MQPIVYGEYRLEYVLGAISDAQAEEVAKFWLDHRALAKADVARSRTKQVACITRTAGGDIAAIATLYTAGFGNPPRPHYYSRTFIRPADRQSGLATAMVAHLREVLADTHRPEQPEQGLVIEMENPMLMKPGMAEFMKSFFWSYEGRNADGMDVWRIDWQRMRPPAGWLAVHGPKR